MNWLDGLLTATAEKFPGRTSLCQTDGHCIDYRSLNEAVNSFAEILSVQGIDSGARVGILAPKSITSVTAILATLRTNAAYVPVDAHGPISRASYIFRDCGVTAIFVAKELTAGLVEALEGPSRIVDLGKIDLLLRSPEQVRPEMTDRLAYILYTSGSTGRPKGVMISHENARCFVEWAAECFGITENDVLSSIAPFHFDLSVFDLFVALYRGAKLVLFNQQAAKNPLLIAEKIGSERISVVYATPTLLQLLLNYGKLERYEQTSLRTVLYAGEVFPVDQLRSLAQKLPGSQFYNLYGPTETNVVTWHRLRREVLDDPATTAIPIGRPCPFADCRILVDGTPELPQPGRQGELVVGGASVALGYQGLEAQTAAGFFNFREQRWYRTGDIVLVDDAHDLVFVGRKDRMIKRRGYRIEMAEIETALATHSDIQSVALVDHPDKRGDTRITAFLLISPGREQPDFIRLKTFSRQVLPTYMIPDAFRVLKAFPLTSSQKIDYQQLKATL